MLVPLLLTIPALLTSPESHPAPVIDAPQAIVGNVTEQHQAALAAFEESVQDYTARHQRLARLTPPLAVTADPAALRDAIDALGQAIRQARQTARAGDLFTPAVARMFRQRIHAALWDLDVPALIADMEADAEPWAPRPTVNGPFPWDAGNAMWPSVLAALPALPEELEYRFVGVDLVLVDIPANLVVDVLEGALTPSS